MNNENLVPQSRRTKSEQREVARKGGIASGEARRAQKTMREIVREILHSKKTRADGSEVEVAALIANRMAMDAAGGNVKAAKLIVDWSGEAPTRQEFTGDDGQPILMTLADIDKRYREQEDGDKE